MNKNDQYREWQAEKNVPITVRPQPPATNTNAIPSKVCPATASTSSCCSSSLLSSQCSGSTSSSGKPKTRQRPRNKKTASRLRPVHLKLAEDDAPTSQSESDCSAYDSFNEEETDFCRDESDESEEEYIVQHFDFEYEVQDLSESDALESYASSSGGDDIVYNDVIAKEITEVMGDLLHGFRDSDFTIYADVDTGESDSASDPELSRADYWKCIKCKNNKNNPMYRFCEKCFQIRKNHFPPRPKHRKKRSSIAARNSRKFGLGSPSSRSSASSSANEEKHCADDGRCSPQSNSDDGLDDIDTEFVGGIKTKQVRAGKQRRRTRSLEQSNSAGESGCSSSQELSTNECGRLARVASSQDLFSDTELSCAPACAAACSSAADANATSTVVNSTKLNLFEHNYPPDSQETFYPESQSCSQLSVTDAAYVTARPLGKCDSLSSTSSGYSSGITSCDSQVSDRNDSCSPASIDSQAMDSCQLDTEAATTSAEQALNERDRLKKSAVDSSPSTTPSTKKGRKRKYSFDDSDTEIDDHALMTKKFQASEPTDTNSDLCMICLTEPKNGAFIHNRCVHVCCCYRCTVKVWNKRKRCPICNLQRPICSSGK